MSSVKNLVTDACAIEEAPGQERSASQQKPSILQVGLRSCVFIFDLFAVTSDAQLREAFSACISAIFSDHGSIKAGFGISEDLSQLQKSWPEISGFAVCESVVDVGKMSASIKRPTGGKLSDLAEMWLGKPMDKAEQTSEWNTRPLDPEQVRQSCVAVSGYLVTSIT